MTKTKKGYLKFSHWPSSKFELVMQKVKMSVCLCRRDMKRESKKEEGGIVVVCIGKQMYLMRLSTNRQLCAFQT